MRKFNINTAGGMGLSASFEEEELATAVDVSDDGILAAESAEELADIEADLSVVESLEARALGLEGLAEVVEENVDAATPSEIQLIDVAQDMAGVGMDGMEIPETFEGAEDADGNVSMESFIGRRVSTEGMRDKVRQIYEAIMKIVERLWDKVMGLWNSFFDQSKSVVNQAKKLSVAAEAKAGNSLKKDKNTIDLGSLGKTLTQEGKTPAGPGDVVAALNKVRTVGNAILVDHAKAVIDTGPKIKDAMKSLDVSKAKKGERGGASGLATSGVLRDVVAAAEKLTHSVSKNIPHKITGDKAYESDTHDFFRSDYLPGNRMIVAKVPKKINSNVSNAYGEAHMIRGISVSMVMADKEAKSAKEVKIKPLTPGEVVKIADTVIEALGALREYRDNHLRTLQKQKGMLKDAANGIKGGVTDDTHPDAIKMANMLIGFNSSYASWSTSPFAAMGSLTLATARAAISVGHKSLACYEAA